jgi:small-conductance mechanosensitive channel
MLLLVLAPEEAGAQSPAPGAGTEELLRGTGQQAAQAGAELWETFVAGLPRYLIALGLLAVAWLLTRLVRTVVRGVLGGWERASGVSALASIALWVLALGVAVSVLAGDVRGLIGSLGLVGLALSWALQAPIESFTGWLLNSLRGYYRVGDRVEVGDVFGDVWRIDLLTTTVWEIGSPSRPGFVRAEQPTGRLITFPNGEVLNGTVVNLTRDFPWLWDEATVPVANESDLRYAAEHVRAVADAWLGDQMEAGAAAYEGVLERAGLPRGVPRRPEVFVGLQDAWTDLTVRYLVPARERRKWKSELVLRLSEELARPEHAPKIIPALPRQQLQLLGADGRARDPAV